MQAGHGSQPDDVGVEWLKAKGSWMFYIGVLLSLHYIFRIAVPSFQAWTAVNILHAIATLYFFHWLKGNPFTTYWGLTPPESDRFTWWEQIDRRWQNTPSRKFCTFIVIALFLLAVVSTPPDHPRYVLANLVASAVVFIAKLPAMDEIRIFGINK
eukprot:Plantae.Rhodophyta-Hildenbrandia_rubra.ctg7422.p1 GENE.Plantae.Rhodophyta-Hildenbrandia_rubra.ctg7422~~Plantae.Rhodophyta-Hildenbrandia_rubra.ctg7422.p1  ORF type:complete len:155 (-),score=18.19 Plantae.Rhodophyta-Hildenbrandia_rubra.ctg7422:413-877(-)